jgi:DNA-binding NtrC family response regulator
VIIAGATGLPVLRVADHHGSMTTTTRHDFAPLQAMAERAKRQHIRHALERCEISVTKTAELLGISRKTLWEKMRRLGNSA